MKKIVTIGGGTGHFSLLSALKDFDIDLKAVVSMVDSGGSTGRLRDEYGVLPPGDVLKCLIALSAYPDAREILQSRFQKSNRLKNHNAGNLLLVFLSQYLSHDFPKAIEALGEILNIKGEVLPVTTDKATLVAELDNGKRLFGESEIDVVRGCRDSKIKRTYLVPHHGSLEVHGPVREAIEEADYVFIGPGDLYTSLTPNFLFDGIKESIEKSKAKFVYFTNIMTKYGETDGFHMSDFVNVIENYMGRSVDLIVANSNIPSSEVQSKYKIENSHPVEIDVDDERLIDVDLLSVGNLARHDFGKLKQVIDKSILNIQDKNWTI